MDKYIIWLASHQSQSPGCLLVTLSTHPSLSPYKVQEPVKGKQGLEYWTHFT